MTVADRFGVNLLRCRRRVRLSQEELAVAADLHRTAIGKLENGERVPRIDTLVRLCGALETDAADLLTGIGWEPVETVEPAVTLWIMAKRSKKPADLNRLAAAIVGEATDEQPQEPESQQVRAGRNGGLKGGKVRAKRLSPAKRSEIARAAALARWKGST